MEYYCKKKYLYMQIVHVSMYCSMSLYTCGPGMVG